MRKEKNKKQLENQNEEVNENKLIVKNILEKKRKKWLVSGIITILLLIIIIDIYILVNIGLEKIVLPEFDFTDNKIYSLSEETKSKLKNLQDEVTLTITNYDDSSSTMKFAEKYTTLSDKIKIEKIEDLSSRKDLMDKYSLSTTTKFIIVSSGENETTLNEYSLQTYDYSTYESIDITEEAITNAIVDVTTKDKPKIYFMKSHTEYEVDSYFYTIISSMEEDANEVETLDILTAGGIPEDCDTLVITTLSEDITVFEKDKILEYINKGGELLLLQGADIIGKNLTNFQEVLNQYGITIEKGIVFEGNSSNMLYGYPDFIVEQIQHSSLTEKLNMNLSVCLADAASIKFDEDKLEELNIEYEGLAYTSDKAFIRTDVTIKSSYRTDKDSAEGKLLVGALVNKKIDENNSSKLIIFGNELFASSMPLTLSGYNYYISELYNNSDVVLNSIAHLNEREDIITIRKSYDKVTYTATQLQHNIIMAIIFIIPIVIIIAGIIVWQVRRRKK